MKENVCDILSGLLSIEGNIIGIESRITNGSDLNENGSIKNGASIPDLDMDNVYNMFNAINIGTEAAINKSFMGRMLGRLNVFFSVNSDSRNAKRSADLNLLNSSAINPGSSKLPFTSETVNLYINALGYTAVRREDLQNLEAMRQEFVRLMNDPDDQFNNMMSSWFKQVVYGIPLTILVLPIGLIYIWAMEIMFYYYFILCIMASVEQGNVLGGHRDYFLKLAYGIVASAYKNGSGKQVKMEADGSISISEMNRMIADVSDATSRLKSSLESNRNGTIVEYSDKVKLVETLKDNRVMIQTKYAPNYDMNRKMGGFYNIYVKNIAKKYKKSVSYDESMIRVGILADLMGTLIENGITCDKALTTIVRGLYKA